MNDATRRALGELVSYRIAESNHGVLDKACQTQPREFAKLVEFCQERESPIGYLVNGSKRIAAEADAVAEYRASGDSEKAQKRVRSALNYSRTALGLVPLAEQEDDLREQFPWLRAGLLAECLEAGRIAHARNLDDEAQVLREATARRKAAEAEAAKRQDAPKEPTP